MDGDPPAVRVPAADGAPVDEGEPQGAVRSLGERVRAGVRVADRELAYGVGVVPLVEFVHREKGMLRLFWLST
ncbi:hypothetical protein SVIOM342S_06621 [Streptomyces violaceorubidus]